MSMSQIFRTNPAPHARILQRTALSILLAGMLAACATGPKNPLTAEQIEALDIQTINVSVASHTPIAWGAGEEAYAESKGCKKPEPETGGSGDQYNVAAAENKKQGCDYDALVSSPEARAFMQARIVEMMEDALKAKVQPAFRGTNAASLNIVVVEVRVISGGQSVFVGRNHVLRATLDVVETKSGQSVASNHQLFFQAGYGPGGFLSLIVEAASSDPVLRLSDG